MPNTVLIATFTANHRRGWSWTQERPYAPSARHIENVLRDFPTAIADRVSQEPLRYGLGQDTAFTQIIGVNRQFAIGDFNTPALHADFRYCSPPPSAEYQDYIMQTLEDTIIEQLATYNLIARQLLTTMSCDVVARTFVFTPPEV